MSPGRLDKELVRRHLAALERSLRQLERHRGQPLERLKDDQDEAWAVERGLQLCAQNALDIATHLCASASIDPADYTAAIDGLVQLGLLPGDFGKRFRAVAGFRNVLVHAYLEVDLERVHALINGSLGDFTEFARLVQGYLSTH